MKGVTEMKNTVKRCRKFGQPASVGVLDAIGQPAGVGVLDARQEKEEVKWERQQDQMDYR